LLLALPASGAELERTTLDAYQRVAARIEREFVSHARNGTPPSINAALRQGHVTVEPGTRDGIIELPGGLAHHWRASAFIPHVDVQQVLAMAQCYEQYARIYAPVIASRLLARHRNTFQTFMRISKGVGPVSAVLDVRSTVRYVKVSDDRVYALSSADRIGEVEHAGRKGERTLSADEGSGYLWRANVLSLFVETDGGVLVHVETLGLSRPFPRFLGFVIEPIARRLGRSSVADSLRELRVGVLDRPGSAPPITRGPDTVVTRCRLDARFGSPSSASTVD
jgi:hypothetical protein